MGIKKKRLKLKARQTARAGKAAVVLAVEEIKEVAEEVADKIAEAAAEAAEKIEAIAEEAKEIAEDIVEEAKEALEEVRAKKIARRRSKNTSTKTK